MPKTRREKATKKNTPYTQSASKGEIKKQQKPSKPITKATRIKDANLTDHLDDLLTNLNDQLGRSTDKKKKKTKAVAKDIEAEQREYEKTQHNMEDALGMLTRL